MKVGVFGGTFDPPHIGHLIVAEHVREHLGLGKILFVPASIPPHKGMKETAEPHHRLEMLQISVKGNRFFDISDIELQRGGVSYTVDTLRQLQSASPNDALFFLLGMDMLIEFHTWRSQQEILDLAEVVVLTRPDFRMPELDRSLQRRITMCRVSEIGVSSSEIRRRVKEGRSIHYMVVPAVEAYIQRHRLYR